MAGELPRVTPEARVATAQDEPFLASLIAATVAEELGAAAWPEQLRSQLLGMQVQLRRQAAGITEPMGSEILMWKDAPVGWRLIVVLPNLLKLVEIMVAPGERGKGIGSAAILQVVDRARSMGLPVVLNVNRTNTRAIALYERLGFAVLETNEVQHTMLCR